MPNTQFVGWLTTCRFSDSLARMPTETLAAEVGLMIRAEMGRQRVSMSELGRRTDISRTTLAHQIDVSRVTVDTLVAIAKALNVEVSALLPVEAAEQPA